MLPDWFMFQSEENMAKDIMQQIKENLMGQLHVEGRVSILLTLCEDAMQKQLLNSPHLTDLRTFMEVPLQHLKGLSSKETLDTNAQDMAEKSLVLLWISYYELMLRTNEILRSELGFEQVYSNI